MAHVPLDVLLELEQVSRVWRLFYWVTIGEKRGFVLSGNGLQSTKIVVSLALNALQIAQI